MVARFVDVGGIVICDTISLSDYQIVMDRKYLSSQVILINTTQIISVINDNLCSDTN